MKNLEEFIETNLLTSEGRINGRINDREWWEKKNLNQERDALIQRTSFLGRHVSWAERIYCIQNKISSQVLCKECPNPVKWQISQGKYSTYCSRRCSTKSKETQNKIKETSKKRYGVENFSQSEEFNWLFRTTSMKKYGVHNPAQSIYVKNTTKNSFLKYEGGHPLRDPKIKKKVKESCLKKYDASSPLESTEIQDKIKSVFMERYGVDHPSKVPAIASKMSNSIRKSKLLEESYTSLLNKQYLYEKNQNLNLSQIAKELGVSKSTVGVYFRRHNLEYRPCFNSTFEDDICNFLTEQNVNYIRNTRSIIPPFEVDIYLPDFFLGIECNGSYWHSELNGKDRNYHRSKTVKAKEKGIHLIHLWHHQWIQCEDLIRSRILSLLGKNKAIGARLCSIANVTNSEANRFLNKNHIQGSCPAGVRLGLYFQNDLVALMTFGKARYNKSYQYELLRYSSKMKLNIAGGPSRLFNRFVREYTPQSIISYSDRSWNKGKLYSHLGFDHSHSTSPSYFYTKDYTNFENRVAFQKHKLKNKLEIFDPTLTEWENMQMNGYDRIWDCGHDVWSWYSK